MLIGPSLGFGTTTLALCDVVYAVPEATFGTPFMKLGTMICGWKHYSLTCIYRLLC